MTPQSRSPLVGVLRVARGRPDGFAQFDDTPRAFLASFAPLAAIQVAPSLWLPSQGYAAVVNLLAAIVALLAGPVLSHALARQWGRETEWLRYAVATNWSIWAVLLFAAALAPVLLLLALLNVPPVTAVAMFALGGVGYVLWLQWFIARHTLALPAGRALAFALLVDLGTFLLATMPQVLGRGGAS